MTESIRVLCALAASLAVLAAPFYAMAASSEPAAPRPAAGNLPSDAYEQPRHRVVLSQGAAELRAYEPMLLAEVSVQGERNAAAREGFKLLARYIFGGNTRRESIAMTAPVIQAAHSSEGERIAMTAPVMQAPATAADGAPRWTVAFMLPSTYTLDTVPRPQDERVQFRVAPGEYRAAVRFSGFSTVSNLQQHREQLLAFVRERGLVMLGEPAMAFYDDPFTLPWNRRNEWWVAVQPPAG
jgi:hypothetical protein